MTGNPIAVFKVPSNNANSNLDGAITDVAATLAVTAGEGANFPSTADGDFWVTVDTEVMLCTSRAGDTLTVTRAQQSTSGVAHDDGAAVELLMTQEAFEDIHSNIVTGVLQGWAVDTDTGVPVSIGTLPANHFVWRVSIYCLELFDAGAQTISVGYTAAATYLVDTFAVGAAIIDNVDDDGHADAGAGIMVVSETARAIEILVNAAASTTGKVYVVVHYIVPDDIPA